jgi:hypothetical protein
LRVAVLFVGTLVSGCASTTQPAPLPVASQFDDRMVVQAANGIAVGASALGRDESEALFGVPLNDIDVQPVWLDIDNQRDEPFWIFPLAVDPEYFPAYEVARRFGQTNLVSTEELYARLRDMQLPFFLPPRTRSSGFVYARSDEGMKAFVVELHGLETKHDFSFVVPVPGFPTDFLEVTNNGTDPNRGRLDLDEHALQVWLESFACCTHNADGAVGDPVNVVLVGSLELVRDTLIALQWDATVPADGESIARMIDAFLSGSRYRYAPISALYLLGREHDLAFQKARDVIDERNHMRLWRAPVTFEGQEVWLGQISRDVGVKLTWKLWPPTTHVIDPDVDEARFHLLQGLLADRAVSRLGFVFGQRATTTEFPHTNAEGDPYFTDGLRAVFVLSDDAVDLSEIGLLPWRLTPEMEPYREFYILYPESDHGASDPINHPHVALAVPLARTGCTRTGRIHRLHRARGRSRAVYGQGRGSRLRRLRSEHGVPVQFSASCLLHNRCALRDHAELGLLGADRPKGHDPGQRQPALPTLHGRRPQPGLGRQPGRRHGPRRRFRRRSDFPHPRQDRARPLCAGRHLHRLGGRHRLLLTTPPAATGDRSAVTTRLPCRPGYMTRRRRNLLPLPTLP